MKMVHKQVGGNTQSSSISLSPLARGEDDKDMELPVEDPIESQTPLLRTDAEEENTTCNMIVVEMDKNDTAALHEPLISDDSLQEMQQSTAKLTENNGDDMELEIMHHLAKIYLAHCTCCPHCSVLLVTPS